MVRTGSENSGNLSCPICTGKNIGQYLNDTPGLKKCGNCSTVFTFPLPGDLIESYNDDYYKLWHEQQFKPRQRLWRRRIETVKKFTPAGRLLDIGTGDGHFLKIAKDEKFIVYGTEVSPAAVNLAKRLFGLDIFPGEIKTSTFPENFFDVVTVWHVIEHVPDPLAMLKKAYGLAKPGGTIFVATPNLNRYPNRIIYQMIKRKPFPFYTRTGEQHLFHFTEKTLTNILGMAGFNIVHQGIDFAAVRLKDIVPERFSFSLSAIFRQNWNENILVIGQK